MKKSKDISRAIKAISDGLIDGGCVYATNFPGFHSHQIFNQLGWNQISLNEKISYQMAFGASMAGKRSVVTMKSVGLNVALDEYLHSILSGINAGLIIILTEDLNGQSSPEIQDSRPLIDMYGGLWLEPISIKNAYELAYNSFDISEKLDIPVVIRLTNSFFKSTGKYSRKKKKNGKKLLETRRDKYISYWKSRDKNLKNKNKNIQSYVEKIHQYKKKGNLTRAAISIGCSKPASDANLDIFKIFTYPLPIKKIRKFIKGKDKIEVYEQGDNYAYKKILSGISKDNLHPRAKSRYGKNIKWKKWTKQEKLFKALKSIKPSFVVADEGTYTDDSLDTSNVCLCMGSSVGITMGLSDNRVKYPFCLTGDTSFLFGGIHTIVEAIHRNLKFGIIVIDNGGAASTGGQTLAGSISDLNKNISKKMINYNTATESQFKKAFLKMQKDKKLSILYVKI